MTPTLIARKSNVGNVPMWRPKLRGHGEDRAWLLSLVILAVSGL